MRVEQQSGLGGVARRVAAPHQHVVLRRADRLHRDLVFVVTGPGPHPEYERVGARDQVRPAMADLTAFQVSPRDFRRRAAAFRHAPDPAHIRRRKVDVAVWAPVAAAMERSVGKRLQRRATHRDLSELRAREERDPLSVRRKERPVAALGAIERLRHRLVQRANVDLRLAAVQSDKGDARAIIGQRERQQIGRAQFDVVGQDDADVRDALALSGVGRKQPAHDTERNDHGERCRSQNERHDAPSSRRRRRRHGRM